MIGKILTAYQLWKINLKWSSNSLPYILPRRLSSSTPSCTPSSTDFLYTLKSMKSAFHRTIHLAKTRIYRDWPPDMPASTWWVLQQSQVFCRTYTTALQIISRLTSTTWVNPTIESLLSSWYRKESPTPYSWRKSIVTESCTPSMEILDSLSRAT